jgi:hypothetical protein
LEQIELARAIRMRAVKVLIEVDPDYADEVQADMIWDLTAGPDVVPGRI